MQRQSTNTLTNPLLFLFFLSLPLIAACTQGSYAEKTGPDKSTRQGLADTSWQLHAIRSMTEEQPITNIEQPERYTLHFKTDGHLALRLDCNRGMGQWQATPAVTGESSGHLTFGPIAMTRMLCPPPSLDARVARDLSQVRSYLLRDGKLSLSLMTDGGLYEWLPTRNQP